MHTGIVASVGSIGVGHLFLDHGLILLNTLYNDNDQSASFMHKIAIFQMLVYCVTRSLYASQGPRAVGVPTNNQNLSCFSALMSITLLVFLFCVR